MPVICPTCQFFLTGARFTTRRFFYKIKAHGRFHWLELAMGLLIGVIYAVVEQQSEAGTG